MKGLINYFEKPLLQQLIKAIATYGKDFKELHYLTDLYPEPTQNKLATIIWNSSRLLKWMSRSALLASTFRLLLRSNNFFMKLALNR